jgi:hypothetical protein
MARMGGLGAAQQIDEIYDRITFSFVPRNILPYFSFLGARLYRPDLSNDFDARWLKRRFGPSRVFLGIVLTEPRLKVQNS